MTKDLDVRMLLFRARLLLEEGQADKALPTLRQYELTIKKSSKRSHIYWVGATLQINVGMMLLEFYHLFLNLRKTKEVKRTTLIVYVLCIPFYALAKLPSISTSMKMLRATTQGALKSCKAKKINFPWRNSRRVMALL